MAIEGKTASLLSTACRIGGIVADLPRDDIDRLTEFGRAYGMAFQIVDDVLDVIATDEQLGKPAAHDLVEGAYNLPTLRALAGPHGDELRTLLGAPIEGGVWTRARDLVRQGDAVDTAIDTAREYVVAACDLLAPFEGHISAAGLQGASRHLIDSLEAIRTPA
jgi:heptaprenyl diphosphate synthase